MKKTSLIVLLLCTIQVLYSAGLNGNYFGTINPFIDSTNKFVSISQYTFNNNEYYFTTELPGTKAEKEIPKKFTVDNYYEERGIYKLVSLNNFTKITFESENGYSYKKELNILYSDRRMFLYEGNNLFFQPDEDLRWEGLMPSITGVSTSSYLKEGAVKYDGNNFIPLKSTSLKPWVEGAVGTGEGEWIEFTIARSRFSTSYLLLSNGYVDYKKTNLYKLNSRIKKLRIESLESGIDFIVELKDSPMLQVIRLPKAIEQKTSKVRLTIVDVYKGEAFSDTCLNMLIPMGDLP